MGKLYFTMISICFLVYSVLLAIENKTITGIITLVLFCLIFGVGLQGVSILSTKLFSKKLDFKESIEVVSKGYLMLIPFLGISILSPLVLGNETILPITTTSIMAGATGASIELSLNGVKGKLPFISLIVIGFIASTIWVFTISTINTFTTY